MQDAGIDEPEPPAATACRSPGPSQPDMRFRRFRAVAARWPWVLTGFTAAVATAAAAPIGEDGARHLLARTGYGPTAAEIRDYAPLERDAAVARVLGSARTKALTPPPPAMLAADPMRPPRETSGVEERRAFVQRQIRAGIELRGWWLSEMLATDSPITERMTLFWHNHFVSSQQKVRIARLMYRQNVTLRAHALGDFGALLHAIAKDPAMLVYLDGVQNRRAAPNENFAREVMELFTLGEGRYTERDVKEAARAFSGWSLERDTGTFVFRRALHDPGDKTILGRTGRFDGDAVLDLLLAQEATAELVVGKLWREFVSPDPDAGEVRRIAGEFRRSGYRIPDALSALLRSDRFWAEANRGVLIKSPVELVVGTLRSLEIEPADAAPFAIAAAGMGQNLLSPPNVRGWRGGEAWIDTNTLLARKQFVAQFARYEEMRKTPSRPERAAAGLATPDATRGMPPDAAADAAADAGMDAQGLRATPGPTGAPAVQSADAAKLRALRAARAVDRAFRELGFSPTRWIAALPGDTPADKRAAAQRVLLPISPAAGGTGAHDEADPLAFLRATLADPVYQLK